MEMINYLPKNWPSLTNYFYNNWPAIVLFIAGIFALLATFFSTTQDSQQKNNIEQLGFKNKELSEEVKKLGTINNTISTRIEEITTANKKTVDENLLLSRQSRELISEVQKLTGETKTLVKLVNERTAYAAAENLQSGELHITFEPTFQNIISGTIGGMTSTSTIENINKGNSLFKIGGKDPLSMKFDHKKMLISMRVFDLEGHLIAEVENNYWRPNKNFTGKMNYDDKGFEVIDNMGNIAVSIDIVGNNQIIIQGIFPMQTEKTLIIAGKGSELIRLINTEDEAEKFGQTLKSYNLIVKSKIENVQMRQLFEYTGKNWLHKRKVGD